MNMCIPMKIVPNLQRFHLLYDLLLAIVNSSGLALSVDSIKINQIHKLLYIVIGHFQIIDKNKF